MAGDTETTNDVTTTAQRLRSLEPRTIQRTMSAGSSCRPRPKCTHETQSKRTLRRVCKCETPTTIKSKPRYIFSKVAGSDGSGSGGVSCLACVRTLLVLDGGGWCWFCWRILRTLACTRQRQRDNDDETDWLKLKLKRLSWCDARLAQPDQYERADEPSTEHRGAALCVYYAILSWRGLLLSLCSYYHKTLSLAVSV